MKTHTLFLVCLDQDLNFKATVYRKLLHCNQDLVEYNDSVIAGVQLFLLPNNNNVVLFCSAPIELKAEQQNQHRIPTKK